MTAQNNANNNEQLLLPDRLGDPQRYWRTDPRVDTFMIAALAQCGLDDAAAPASVKVDSSLKEKRGPRDFQDDRLWGVGGRQPCPGLGFNGQSGWQA